MKGHQRLTTVESYIILVSVNKDESYATFLKQTFYILQQRSLSFKYLRQMKERLLIVSFFVYLRNRSAYEPHSENI